VAVTAPAPRPSHRFWRCDDRWMPISRHPGFCVGPLPSLAVRPTRDSSCHSKRLPVVSPTDRRSELDPRSLDPAALFGARLPSLFEVRRRLSTSATAFDVRATEPTTLEPRRDGNHDSLPFLHPITLPLLEESGDRRRAALRPSARAPVLVLPGYPGLPNRDALTYASPPKLSLTEHSEDLRARVEGPSEGRVPSSPATISRACAWCIRLMRAC